MRRRGHLADDRLVECYFADRHGEPPDPRAAEHLADCPACRARFETMVQLLDGVREDTERETDAVFTPERLRAGHLAVMRRIDHLGRSARIISFPAQAIRRTMSISPPATASRWIAAAAAAGVFIGIAFGASYKWDWRVPPTRPIESIAESAAPERATVEALSTEPVGATPEAELIADDEFLLDLDAALDRPRTSELLSFDALTPHVREINYER